MNKVDNYIKAQGLYQVTNLGRKLQILKQKNEVSAENYLKAFGYKTTMINKILRNGGLCSNGNAIKNKEAIINPNKTRIHLSNV